MKRLRGKWDAWVADPDWDYAHQVGFQLEVVFVVNMFGLLCWIILVALVDTRFQNSILTAFAGLIALVGQPFVIFMAYKVAGMKKRRRSPLIEYPGPPTRRRAALLRSHVKSVGHAFLGLIAICGGTFFFYLCLLWLVIASFIPKEVQANLVVGLSVPLIALGTCAIAVFVIWTRLKPTIAELARADYQSALASVTSPALAGAGELVELADDLSRKALSTETLLREVEISFKELSSEVLKREAERLEILGEAERIETVSKLSESQMDALFAIQDERQRTEKKRDRRRDFLFFITGIVIALLIPPFWELVIRPLFIK